MKSMTGYGFAEVNTPGHWFSLELKSYNNRYLDIEVRLPGPLASLEPRLKERLGDVVTRGKVEFTLRWKETGSAPQVTVQLPLVEAFVDALAQIRDAAGLQEAITLNHLLKIPELFALDSKRDPEALWALFQEGLEKVLLDFSTFRAREGQRTQDDISRELSIIQAEQQSISSMEADLETQFKAHLIGRIQEMVAEYDPNRVLTEVALLLMRYGIHEELVRLETHTRTFADILKIAQPAGKKLDFLCQEMGREINTIGSKTTSAVVQQKVVSMKEALENIREQLRNVE